MGDTKTCAVPITYSLNGNSYVVNPGKTKALPGSHFTQVSVVESTHITLPPNVVQSDFSPDSLLHTVSFGTAGPPPSPTPNPSPKTCPALLHNLWRGSRGGDVSTLQNFLISAGLLANGSVTGYFGALTEHAVQSWQSAHGVVTGGSPSTTGYGFVGPRTRSALSRCDSL